MDISESFRAIAEQDVEWADKFFADAVGKMSEAVRRYGGTASGRGDGIMAVFGAPVAHEDHAIRACLAALAIRDLNKRALLPELPESKPALRMGINSGEAVVRVTEFGLSVQYDAIGQAVHLAARMEQKAEPGSILITGSTYSMVEGMVRVRPLGALVVKGLSAPVETYELLGPTLNAPRIRVTPFGKPAPFVDRRDEFATLERAARRARAGTGQALTLVGEAGCGKSRLVAEFVQSDIVNDWSISQSGCTSYDSATDCAPFANLLRRQLQIGAEPSREELRNALAIYVDGFGEKAPSLVSPLLAVLGIDPEDDEWNRLTPMDRRTQIVAAVVTILLQETRQRPLLLVLEDMHWADAATRLVLQNVLAILPTSPLLCIVTARPGSELVGRDLLENTTIAIDPLPEAEAEELVSHILGRASEFDTTKRMLARKTGGNPLFIEECVRSLVDEKFLVGEPGAFKLGRQIADFRAPATISSVIASRIDRLSADDKHVLLAAAAIGPQVPIGLLAETLERSESSLQSELDDLQQAGFIEPPEVGPAAEYTFRHELLRAVAYDGMLRSQRASLHAKILAAMERSLEERKWELAERFAYHAVASGIPEKAIFYSRLAGGKASNQSACEAAITHYKQAIDVAEELPDSEAKQSLRIDLRLELRNPLFQLGELSRVHETLREADAISATILDKSRMGRTALYMSHISWLMGRHRDAVAYGRKAAAIGAELGDVDIASRSDFYIGLGQMGLGDFEQTVEYMRRTVSYFGDKSPEENRATYGSLSGVALAYLIRSLAELGRLSEAAALAAEAGVVAEAEGPLSEMIAAVSIGYLRDVQGDGQAALELLVGAHELCKSSHARLMLAVVESFLGGAYLSAGRPDLASTVLTEAIEEGVAMRLLYYQPVRLAHLARAKLELGEVAEARKLALAAIELARTQEEAASEALAHLSYAEACLAADSAVEDAIRAARDASNLAHRLKLVPAEAQCALVMARAHHRLGDNESAEAFVRRAHEILEGLGAAGRLVIVKETRTSLTLE